MPCYTHRFISMLTCSTAALVAAAMLSGPAVAQDTATPANEPGRSNVIEEIVVTATKREQNLSDVGISVSVLGGSELTRMGLTDSTAIVNAVPNLENAAVFGPGSNTNFSIRGVAQNDYNDATESPIATYLDDVYLVPTGAGSFPLYDMERVEVLRGPQGTLFGRNSTGGLIHFITAKPKSTFEASISGKYGSYDTREITGMINLPVGETLAIRLAGHYHKNDGWLSHYTGNQPDRGQTESASIRGQVRWEPSTSVTNTLKVSHDKAQGNSTAVTRQAIGMNATTGDQYVLGPNEDYYGTGPQRDAFGQENRKRTDNGDPTRLRGAWSTNVANRLEINLDPVTITSVTGYNRFRRDQAEDCDYGQLQVCTTHRNNIGRQYSQELRAFGDFDNLRFTLGAYYLDHKIELDENAPLLRNTAAPFSIRVQANQRSKSYALFGNLEYDLSPQFTFIAGLRGSRDKKHFEESLRYLLPADPANPFPNNANILPKDQVYGAPIAENIFTDETAGDLTRLKKDTWSAKLELDYKPAQDTLIYASFSRGVKSPGYNNGIVDITIPPEDFKFKAETLLAYELGLKSTFMDRRANLNIAAFYYDYSNFHTLSFEGIGSFIANRDASLYGAEGEFTFLPVEGLTLKLNGGLIHSKLKDVANGGGVVADRKMPLAPEWSTGAMIRYEADVGAGNYRLGMQVDGRARGSFYNTPGNDSSAKAESIGILNARLDLADVEGRYSLALNGSNILDRRYVTTYFLLGGLGGYRYGLYGPPRTITLELSYRFK